MAIHIYTYIYIYMHTYIHIYPRKQRRERVVCLPGNTSTQHTINTHTPQHATYAAFTPPPPRPPTRATRAPRRSPPRIAPAPGLMRRCSKLVGPSCSCIFFFDNSRPAGPGNKRPNAVLRKRLRFRVRPLDYKAALADRYCVLIFFFV